MGHFSFHPIIAMVTLAPVEPLSGPIIPEGYSKDEYDHVISCASKQMAQGEQVACPLVHHFSPGIYGREIFMPAGTFVIGHKHKTQHLNIVLSGKAAVLMDGEVHYVEAPAILESKPGVQKVLLIEEDMRWMTIHANPSDSRDLVQLEEDTIELDDETKALKGKMTTDEFRMSVNDRIKKEVLECHT